jgi:hypothetical protein
MKWFDRWFATKCKQSLGIEDDTREEDAYVTPMTSSKQSRRNSLARVRDDNDLPEGGLNIQVKSAHGGKIVVFRNYDERNDRNTYTTYLIPDSENFEQSLGKIITIESMKL